MSGMACFIIGLWWYSVHYSVLYLHSSRRRSILLIDTYRAQGHLNAENFVVMSVGKYIRIDGHLSIVHLSIVYIFSYICIHIVYVSVCKYIRIDGHCP
jgi:hypothetical protein